jgi:DNA-directed RNA polymerase specialized sigma24 family protein
MCTLEVGLGEAERKAFRLYAIEGRDAGETAAALGMTVNQVYQAKSRILKRLEDVIELQVRDEG